MPCRHLCSALARQVTVYRLRHRCPTARTAARPIPEGMTIFCLVAICIVAKLYVLAKNCLKERIGNRVKELIFWVAAVFLLPVSPIWPPKRPFLPYGRPNLALAGLLVPVGIPYFSLVPFLFQHTVNTHENTWSAIHEDCEFDAVGQTGTVLIARDVPREFDEHVVKRGGDAHRQRSVDDVVSDEARKSLVSPVVYLQSTGHSRLVIHLQHVQRYALTELRLKTLQPQTSPSDVLFCDQWRRLRRDRGDGPPKKTN